MEKEELKKRASAFSVPEGKFVEEEAPLEGSNEPIKNSSDDSIKVNDEGAPKPTGFNPSPIWGVFKEKFGIDAPQDLSPENELEVISSTIEKIKPNDVKLHPMALDLNQKLADPEFSFDQWAEDINAGQKILTLKGRDFFQKCIPLEYPDATEDDIEEMISEFESSGRLKSEELRMKKEIRTRQEQDRERIMTEAKANQDKAINEANQKIEAELINLFAETKKVTEIYGVPISEADREAFNSTFRELTKRNESGKMPLSDLLQSNMDIWKYAFLVLNGSPKIKEALFNAKEGTKAEIFNKLRPQSMTGLGAPAASPGPKNVDYSRLKEPQQ